MALSNTTLTLISYLRLIIALWIFLIIVIPISIIPSISNTKFQPKWRLEVWCVSKPTQLAPLRIFTSEMISAPDTAKLTCLFNQELQSSPSKFFVLDVISPRITVFHSKSTTSSILQERLFTAILEICKLADLFISQIPAICN